MKPSIEQKLIAARTSKEIGNEHFIASVMKGVKAHTSTQAFHKAVITARTRQHKTLWTKFRKLPATTIAAITIAVLLGTSAAAYAAYQLWGNPTVTVKSVTTEHNRGLVTLDLRNCNEPTQQYELKPGYNFTPTQVANYVEAYCQTEAIQSWAMQQFGVEASEVFIPATVNHFTKEQLSFTTLGTAHTLQLTNTTTYVTTNQAADFSILKDSEAVAVVQVGNQAKAVVALNLQIAYYNPTIIGQDFFQSIPCPGNPTAACVATGSIDVYGNSESNANAVPPPNPTYIAGGVIQGALTNYSATGFVIKASNNQLYTITVGQDIVDNFNAAGVYAPVTINIGDVLNVSYVQPSGANPNVITGDQLQSVTLMLANVSKAGLSNADKYHY